MENLKSYSDLHALPQETILNLSRKNQVFQDLTSDFDIEKTKEAWNKELDDKSLTSSNYTYGEVDFLSLAETFEIIKTRHGPIKPGGTFYDLGSGSGKGVVSAALIHDFDKCKGIEVLESLYDISTKLFLSYQQVRLHLVYNYPDLWDKLPDIEFIFGDMFNESWTDASFIFVNSTCFDSKMMEMISNREVNPGTWAVTLTKALKSSKWVIKQSLRKPMSWGEATIYIHERVN